MTRARSSAPCLATRYRRLCRILRLGLSRLLGRHKGVSDDGETVARIIPSDEWVFAGQEERGSCEFPAGAGSIRRALPRSAAWWSQLQTRCIFPWASVNRPRHRAGSPQWVAWICGDAIMRKHRPSWMKKPVMVSPGRISCDIGPTLARGYFAALRGAAAQVNLSAGGQPSRPFA